MHCDARERVEDWAMFQGEYISSTSHENNFIVSHKNVDITETAIVSDALKTRPNTQEPSRRINDDRGTLFLRLLWTVRPQIIHWVTPIAQLGLCLIRKLDV